MIEAGQVENQGKVRPYQRDICIIGVGCTPFFWAVENEETNGLTEGEMFGYAALKAMEDAGITPKDIDFYYHGQANPMASSQYMTPNMQVANWFGMKGKGSMHHSEACCTGYLAMEVGANAVASGKYDVVLTGCVEFGDSIIKDPTYPQFRRSKFTMSEFMASTRWLMDNCYTREMEASASIANDDPLILYQRRYGLTEKQMDDALIAMALANRKNAEHTPLAMERKPYEQEAKEAGFDDVWEYMRSSNNPRTGHLMRVSGIELKCDGAAAAIIASVDWAKEHNLPHTPINIMGIGCASCEMNTPHLETKATEESIRQVYEMTGVKPEEIDLLMVNDFSIGSQIVAAEAAGYLPRGEGWKYFIDGRTTFDGDRPINTNGGRTSFGHAHAASGLADVYEAVMQMRGLAEGRQVKKRPRTTLLRGYGGGQNFASIILRTNDELQRDDAAVPKIDSPIKLEKVVQKYYESLEKGVILGRKCKKCGHVEWPPVYACNKCGCDDTEWVEMSGKGEATTIVLPSVMNTNAADLAPFTPYFFSTVTMDGAEANAVVMGKVNRKNLDEMWDKMPLPVKAKIVDRGEGDNAHKTVFFELDTEELAKR